MIFTPHENKDFIVQYHYTCSIAKIVLGIV